MQKGLYEGGLIRGVTQVVRKRWAYLREGLYAGEGGLIGREIQYLSFPRISKGSNMSRVISIYNSVAFIGTLRMTY